MRSEWKASERVALSLFARALEAHGIPPIHAPEISDAPDALFLVKGEIIAVECRYIAHPELLKFLGKRHILENRAYEILLPREPHLWVRNAIEEKHPYIPKYLARTGAREVWLLLHSSHQHKILRNDRSEGSEFFELLCLGAHLLPHGFTRVWFAELGESHTRAVEIYGPDLPKPTVNIDDYIAKFPPYPLDHIWFVPATVNASSSGEKSVTINLNNPATDPVCIQPIDSRFQIDYVPYLSNPMRNSDLSGLKWAFYDDRPSY